jgi:hypothetical protein
MARFRIPVENLPNPNINGRHLFRFRIVSEDRNRTSQYSPLFTVESKGQIYPLETEATVVVSASVVNVYWETPSVYNIGASAIGNSIQHNHESEWKVHPSDIFVSWDNNTFIYYGRSSDSEIGIIIPQGVTNARILGQVANYPPTISPLFKIFDTGTVPLV